MRSMSFAQAIEDALAFAMENDDNVFIMGEDVALLRANLVARFGTKRVRETPISESAFLGASVTAAMAGFVTWLNMTTSPLWLLRNWTILLPDIWGLCSCIAFRRKAGRKRIPCRQP